MRRFRMTTGSEFTEGGRLHRIGERTSAAGEPGWFVTCLETADMVVRTLADLQRAHSAGELVGHPAGAATTASDQQARRTRSDDELSDAEGKRKRERLKFLKYVERNLPPAARKIEVKHAGTGEVKTAFESVIEEAAAHAALTAVPSPATYYRWLKLHGEKGPDALVGNYSNCGNRGQIEPTVKRIVKDTFRIVLDEAVAATKAGCQVRLRMRTLTKAVDAAIAKAEPLNPTVALIRPSRSTLYDWWGEMPAVKRDTLRLGVVKARQAYRFTKGHEHPVNALDEAEFDECDTPIFVCDDSGVLLGRLTLCWTMDVACHAVSGIDLSFEPPGDTTMMSTFKNAIMSKSYLTRVFPELSGRWLQYGIPRLIRVDRSRQALGKTAEELSMRLDIDWDWCDAMTPYFKAYVEMMFRILNQMLLEELPGYVLPVHLRRPDYDPTKNGLIRIRDLMCVIHAFVIFYNEKPQASLGGSSPNAVWLRSTARVAPELPDDAEDMARLFAILREAGYSAITAS